MAIPQTIQLFNAFLGDTQSANVLILPDAFSSGGSKNVWMDKFGRVKKIDGYAPLSSTSYSGVQGFIQSVFQGHFSSLTAGYPGQDLTKTLIWQSRLQTSATINTSTDGGLTATVQATSLFPVTSDYPDYAQYGQTVYMTSRTFGNYSWDGTTAAAISVTQSPTITASEGSTGVLNGSYKWKLVSINSTTGARKAGSVASTILTTTNKQGSLSWTADADTAYGGYELYRTTGTGNLFYFVTYIDGRATASYTDNTLDQDIFQNRVLEEHGDAPPTDAYGGAFYVEAHKGRVWWGGTTTHPDRAWWSDVNLPTSVLDSNYLDFSDAEIQGDRLTGLLGSFNDNLVVFTERAVWVVSGTGSIVGRIADWNRQRSNARTGSVGSRSAVRVPAGARYLNTDGTFLTTGQSTIAYWTPLGDTRLFDGLNDTIISLPMKDTLATWSYADRAMIHAVHDPDHSQIIWWYPTGTNTDTDGVNTFAYPDQAIVWNYQWGTWTTWTDQVAHSSILVDSSTDPAYVLIGSARLTDVHTLSQLWSGNAFGTLPITATWMTKPLYGTDENGVPILSSRKRWRWADLRLSGLDPDATITVEWVDAKDGDTANAIASATLTLPTTALLTADGDTLVDASGNTLVLASNVLHAKVRFEDAFGDYPHLEGIRLRVTESSTTGSWALDGFTIASQTLPGQKRRMDE